MKDSGLKRKTLKALRNRVRVFCKGSALRLMIDISGLAHGDVGKILGGPHSGLSMLTRFVWACVLYICPFNGFKIWSYRMMGAKIGKNVYISPGVYIDITLPGLLEIGSDVMIGMGVKIAMHERTMHTLTLGRVKIGNNITIGGASVIRCGTIIGDDAEIDACSHLRGRYPTGAQCISTVTKPVPTNRGKNRNPS